MGTFSQRMGYKSVRSVIQDKSMDDALRNGFWNVIALLFGMSNPRSTIAMRLLVDIYRDMFKEPADLISSRELASFRYRFLDVMKWNEVYDVAEYIASAPTLDASLKAAYIHECNVVLTREMSAYRFVGNTLARITSEDEIVAIEQAMQIPVDPAVQHLRTALALLADRQQPDYRNSIKESISAVETIAKKIDNRPDDTLGRVLNRIAPAIGMHDNLRDAFRHMYWWTSDADGIRHAMMDTHNLDAEDARYMLVACSAFVNYLVVKAEKAGIPL
jgi:AbiJ-like protein